MGEDPLALLLEYLDASLQPTFVLHVSTPNVNSKTASEEVAFHHANPALHQHPNVFTELLDASQWTTALTDTFGYQTHNGWTSFAGPCRSPIFFCGVEWSVTTIGDRWIVAVSTAQHEKSTQVERARFSKSALLNYTHAPSSEQVPKAQERTDSSANNDVAKRPPLGSVLSHGHLGNLDHLKWMREFDWASSRCGLIENWSSELRHACEFALATPDPVCIAWGEDLALVYNHGYSIMIGERHPGAMGLPFREVFKEVWPAYRSVFAGMAETGQSVYQEKLKRMLVRDGVLEECYFNIVIASVLAADGSMAGITTRFYETTQRVIFERRMHLLERTSKAMATTCNIENLYAAAASVLDDANGDVLFAALYSTDVTDHAPELILQATAGLKRKLDQIPSEDSSEIPHFGLNHVMLQTYSTRQSITLSTSDGSLTQDTLDQLKEFGAHPCQTVVVHPLRCFIEDSIAAVAVIGASPHSKYDEDYGSFLHLLTSQLEISITVVRGIERELELHRTQVTSEIEKRFMRFAAKAPVGMYIYNTDNVFTYWNAAFEEMVGRSAEELVVPMAWMETLHPDCVNEMAASFERYLRSKSDKAVTFEVQFKKPWTNGVGASLDRTYALGTIHPELAEDGQLQSTLGCITDISSFKWAEMTQARQLAEALEQKRQQENFLDVTSHEMRNPLNAIFHCASELTDNIKHELKTSKPSHTQTGILKDCLDLASTITHCANHQKRIVDEILMLSKLDARLLQVLPESTNPIKLYKDILELFTPEIRASGMNTNFMVGEGYNALELSRVMIDSLRVTQIVINLLSNAIKFTKKGTKRDLEMTLDAHLEEPASMPMGTKYVSSGIHYQDPTTSSEWGYGEKLYLSFIVKDSGLGMTPEEISSLFQKFSQASPRTHIQFGGSGLGLHISRNLAELHGGRIGLSSQVGFGSRFEFYVKVRRDVAMDISTTPSDQTLPVIDLQHMNATSSVIQHALPTPLHNDISPDFHVALTQPPSPLGSTVLIVEDNLINQRLLRKLITKNGYTALAANNGEEALLTISTSSWNPAYTSTHSSATTIDIVLCDIEMPIMDGKTCVRRIRQLQNEGLLDMRIPMVAITGNARAEQVQEMKDCGFDDVVTKPYTIEQLLTVIERFVGRRDAASTLGG